MTKAQLIFLSFFITLTSAVFSQGGVFKGKIVDFVTYQPLPNTCIHNISSGLMTFSSASGDFSIQITGNDTIAISRVGYEMDIFSVNDSLLDATQRVTFRMIQRAIMLREVTIYAMKPYPLFVQDLTKKTPHEKIEISGMEISHLERTGYNRDNGNLLKGTPFASPITYLYERFSHKGKMNRMYANLVEHEEEIIRLEQKYNPDIVRRITRLEGERLEDFMLYCSFTYYILVTSTDLQIEKMIGDKFTLYKRENGL